MDDLPLPGISENDPRNLLPRAARARLQVASIESQLARDKAFNDAEFEYRRAGEPGGDLVAYMLNCPSLRTATLACMSTYLKRYFSEFVALDLPCKQVLEIVREEIESMTYSFQKQDLPITGLDQRTFEFESLLWAAEAGQNSEIPGSDIPLPPQVPPVTDEQYEHERKAAEFQLHNSYLHWEESFCAYANPIIGAIPKVNGERPRTVSLDVKILEKLIVACRDFAHAELHAFATMLIRQSIPPSVALIQVRAHAPYTFLQLRQRKWEQALSFIFSLFKRESRVSGAWQRVENVRYSILEGVEQRIFGQPSPRPSELTHNKGLARRAAVEPRLVALGINAEQWAIRANVDPKTGWNYLNGITKPTASTKASLARVLGIEANDLPA